MTKREAERSKNMFALGLMSWLYHRPTEATIAFIEQQVRKRSRRSPRRTSRAFKAGYAYGETTEDFAVSYEVAPAKMRAGHLPEHHRQPGARARARRGRACRAGCRSSSAPTRSRRPRTILEELSRHKHFGVRTFQAEDEIAAVGAALGASFGGALGVCTSSGPGIVLKAETIGLGGHARAAAR